MKIIKIALILILLCVNNFAQDYQDQKNNLLLGTILKLENNIIKADKNISLYENEILKCEKTIATSENIIKLAKEKGNQEADRIAKEALLKASLAKDKNIKLLNAAKLKKKQSEIILTSVKNSSSQSSNIKAVTLNYSGKIKIQKKNGEQFTINEKQGSILEIGDVISTDENSKIELQFLEGRGNVTVGENSKLKFDSNDSTDVMDMISGKVKMNVQKLEAFYADLEKQYEDYKKSSPTLNKELEQFYAKVRAVTNKKLRKKFEVRTPSFALAIRGTKFIVNASEDKSAEIIVIEGTVEIKSIADEQTILINAGQKGEISNDCKLSDPKNIDLTKLEKWWEDEQ